MIQERSVSYGSSILTSKRYFRLKNIYQKAKLQGKANGCPVSETLLQEPPKGRGPVAMLSRYGEINYLMGYMSDYLSRKNKIIIDEIKKPVKRLAGEPMGRHDKKSIPSKLKTPMLIPIAQYELPRLFVAYSDFPLPLKRKEEFWTNSRNEDFNPGRQSLFLNAIELFEDVALTARSPEELLVKFAEDLVVRTTNKDKKLILLKCLFSKGKLDEDNCFTAFKKLARAMRVYTPALGSYYDSVCRDDKEKIGIIVDL